MQSVPHSDNDGYPDANAVSNFHRDALVDTNCHPNSLAFFYGESNADPVADGHPDAYSLSNGNSIFHKIYHTIINWQSNAITELYKYPFLVGDFHGFEN